MPTYMNEAGQRVTLPRDPDDWCGDMSNCPMTDWELNQIADGLPTTRWGPCKAPPLADAPPVRVLYEAVIQGRRYVERHQYIHVEQLTLGDGGTVVFRGQPTLQLKSQPDPTYVDVYGVKPNRWTGD